MTAIGTLDWYKGATKKLKKANDEIRYFIAQETHDGLGMWLYHPINSEKYSDFLFSGPSIPYGIAHSSLKK